MDWDDVRYFLALARERSGRAAGAALGVSHSTVARRLDALEEQLGVRLFDRSRDGYLLTHAGTQMLAGAERIEREIAALERSLAGHDARLEGTVRVTCTDPFIAQILLRALADLARRHPGIELELGTEGRNLDLSKREADLALRALMREMLPPQHLLGRRVAAITVASYVARAHADRLDPERDLRACRWLGMGRPIEAMIASSSYPSLPAWGSFDALAVIVEAALEGLGLAMLPTYVGDRDPRLVRLARPDLRHVADFWLLSHPDLRDNARLRAAREHVADALLAHAELFEGRDPWRSDGPLRPTDAPRDHRASFVGSGGGE